MGRELLFSSGEGLSLKCPGAASCVEHGSVLLPAGGSAFQAGALARARWSQEAGESVVTFWKQKLGHR